MAHGRRTGILSIAAAALALAVLGLGGAAPAAAASASAAAPPTDISAQQEKPLPQQQRPRRPTRITVVPLSQYYRKCDFWLAVEHRPSGDVITPQQRCVWALR
jgi:hypothetical protein